MSNLPALRQEVEVINFEDYAMTADKIQRQVNMIQEIMAKVMKSGEHYGVIPGTGNKPSLLKPGAEKLSTTFRLAPSYKKTRYDLPDGHREYEIVCTLTHIPTGQVVGEGVGSCSTMESKYRYRNVADFEVTGESIPKDAKEKKKEYRKQGYGMRQVDGVWSWVKYKDAERQENPDIADTYNTVMKMAKKRAHVDAVLTATAASDIFTQDIEDMVDNGAVKPEPETIKSANPPQEPKQKPSTPPPPKFKPCTKEQFKALQDLYSASFNEYSEDHLKAIVAHFKKGERLSYEEAADLLTHWQTRLDEYEEAHTQKEEADAEVD